MCNPDSKTQIDLYVVMPFSKTSETRTLDYWNEHFADFLSARINEVTQSDPILAKFSWRIKRSSVARGGPLNYEIVWDLLTAPIVIADLTDLNFNVLYELGVRHALTAALESQRTIMIQDEAAFKLPFDFANYAVIKYSHDKTDSWKRDLADRLRSCIEFFRYRDNPVSMTFAQHGYSLQPQQDQAMEKFKASLDAVERMKSLGFDVKWIQELIGQSVFKSQGQGSKPELASP
jgi:hypothetical protein